MTRILTAYIGYKFWSIPQDFKCFFFAKGQQRTWFGKSDNFNYFNGIAKKILRFQKSTYYLVIKGKVFNKNWSCNLISLRDFVILIGFIEKNIHGAIAW